MPSELIPRRQTDTELAIIELKQHRELLDCELAVLIATRRYAKQLRESMFQAVALSVKAGDEISELEARCQGIYYRMGQMQSGITSLISNPPPKAIWISAALV